MFAGGGHGDRAAARKRRARRAATAGPRVHTRRCRDENSVLRPENLDWRAGSCIAISTLRVDSSMKNSTMKRCGPRRVAASRHSAPLPVRTLACRPCDTPQTKAGSFSRSFLRMMSTSGPTTRVAPRRRTPS